MLGANSPGGYVVNVTVDVTGLVVVSNTIGERLASHVFPTPLQAVAWWWLHLLW